MHVAVGAVPVRALGSVSPAAEGSAAVRARVQAARERQQRRYAALGSTVVCNAHAPGRWLHAQVPAGPAARALLDAAAERLGMSARAYHRVLKVARTIADLDGDDDLSPTAVAEALRYRPDAQGAGNGVPRLDARAAGRR